MLKVFDSFENTKRDFIPLNGNEVKMYVCGPTVYDFPHLGHARCYITWDVLYRYLKFSGFDVTYCRNVTDVDDKILAKADKQNSTQEEISQKYYQIFADSMKKLNVLQPDVEPFATKTLDEMIDIVKILIEKGFAYEADGDVYFRVNKFPDYCKLSKQPKDDLVAGARVDASDKKEDVLDFALWKKDEKHGYTSPWSKGRPGWHIECSAMAKKHLGTTIDIHAGGSDLIFPHHENEIAQSECANGCKFANYWMHNGFVTINKEKMSKSLGNFITIDDILKDFDSNTIRFFILTNHYRMPVEFNNEALGSAKSGQQRLKNAVDNGLTKINLNDLDVKPENDFVKSFKDAMDDDLNTSVAISVLFELATMVNVAVENNNNDDLKKSLSTLVYLSNVLGFKFATANTELSDDALETIEKAYEEIFGETPNAQADVLMQKIIDERKLARAEKNWAKADSIRDTLSHNGIVLKDTKDGTTWQIM